MGGGGGGGVFFVGGGGGGWGGGGGGGFCVGCFFWGGFGGWCLGGGGVLLWFGGCCWDLLFKCIRKGDDGGDKWFLVLDWVVIVLDLGG